LSYLGCGLEAPYQCPNGLCANDEADCIEKAKGCPSNKPIQCKNMACVEYPGQCEVGAHIIQPLVLQYDLDFSKESVVDFAFHESISVARIHFPSDSVVFDSNYISERVGIERLRIEPIPSS